MNSGKFTKINEAFVCEHCHADVPKSSSTCRNHCPFCLHSKHVDVMPGDRAALCQGLLKPVSYEQNSRSLDIIFRCLKCGDIKRNKALLEDKNQPDDYDEILKITNMP